MNETTLITLAFALAIGLSIALVAWLISRALAAVPAEVREYKDPPPLGLRLVWWPVQWITYYIDGWLSEKTQAALNAKLRRAGLEYTLKPEQFIATRIVSAIIAASFVCWLLASLESPQTGIRNIQARIYWMSGGTGALFGFLYPALWLHDRIQARRKQLLRALPFFLDIITLCVEAGLNLQGAINQAVLKGPKGILRDEFQRVLRDIRAGKPRAEALRNMANRFSEAPLTNFVSSIIQAERVGMSLGPVLRAQADQQRVERFLRAEKLAMEAPVKMLFPLIAFIFPCTFIVLFFPIVIKFLDAGI